MQGQEAKLVVLHVSTPSSWRGGEQQLFYLLESLDKIGVNQILICNKVGALYKKARAAEFNVIGCAKKNGMDLGFSRQIKATCEKMEVQIIQAHDSQAHTLILLANVLFGNKIPVVLSRRVDFSVGGSFFSRYKYNHPMIARILCVSNAIKEIMRPAIKNQALLETVYSGVDLSKFEGVLADDYLRKTFGVPSDYALVGNVSAIAPHKDYFTFVDTVKILLNKGVRAKYFIVGDGPEKEAIKQYVKDNELEGEIYFTGFIKGVLPTLKSLDLMLVTSKTEGLGTTILDAFACGVPVVATKAGGIPEIVIHEHTGLLAEIKDSEKLAECCTQVLGDQHKKEQLIQGAKTLVQEYSTEKTAEKTLAAYQEILK